MSHVIAPFRRRWSKALPLALIALLLPIAGRIVVGPKGGSIHVAYQASVDETARERLEARYRLTRREKLDGPFSWAYNLTDSSSENIRALVSDPLIADTHEIDRDRFTLEPTAPRTARQKRFASGDTIVGALDGLAVTLFALALVLAIPTPLVQLLARGIPVVDATTAGLFRIVFGICVIGFFATHRIDRSWLNVTFDLEIEGPLHAAVLAWLKGHPQIVDAATPWLLVTGVLFTTGTFTRLSYGLFVGGTLLWAFVSESVTSLHPVGTFVLALVALLPAQWGDALSVDAWRRRVRNQPPLLRPASAAYGYCTWIPGLVLGIGFAAAAWAKLTVPPHPTDWILNGTIRYHMLSDAGDAPFDWGIRLAGYPALAIVGSVGVILTEALVVTAGFVRSERYRSVLGLGALCLVGGFFLFMGLFWAGWWIQALGLLPWKSIGGIVRRTNTATGSGVPVASAPQAWIGMAQASMIVFVLGQQPMASLAKAEFAPMFSWYPMYADTYDSTAEWDRRRAPTYHILASTARGTIELHCKPHKEFVREFEQALNGSATAQTNVWQEISGCGEDLGSVQFVTLQGNVSLFDWNRGVFFTHPSKTLGPLFLVDSSGGGATQHQ